MCCEAANRTHRTHIQCLCNPRQALSAIITSICPLLHSYCEIHPAKFETFPSERMCGAPASRKNRHNNSAIFIKTVSVVFLNKTAASLKSDRRFFWCKYTYTSCNVNTCFSFWLIRPLVCEDIQADVEDGQLQFFYILAFVLQGDMCTHSVTSLWNHTSV